jgi:hypothetical protein
MGEAEPARVQAETVVTARAASVRHVADDRMTHRRQLHADLVSASGAEVEVEDGPVASALPHAVPGDRQPPRLPGTHAEVAVLGETALERAFLLAHAPFDHRHVDALDVAGLELRLQTALGALGFREDDQARGVAVQPMDDEEPASRPLRVDVVEEQAVGVLLTLAVGGDGQEARRLVDDEQIVVLVHQPERRWKSHSAVTTERDADGRADEGASVADDLAVHLDAAVLEPLLEARP